MSGPKADSTTLSDSFNHGAETKLTAADAAQLDKEIQKEKAQKEKATTMMTMRNDAPPFSHPGGMPENSPTFQCWGRGLRVIKVPNGTTENAINHIGLIFAIAFCISLTRADSAPLNLIQTIPLPGVKGRFDHFSIDTKGNRLFVAALGNNTVEVIDLAAGNRIHSMPGMSKPQGVLFLPERNELLVANGDDGSLKLLDAATFKMVQTLGGVPDADNLRFDPKTKLAWLGYGDGALAAIAFAPSPSREERAGERRPAQIAASIKISAHPESFQLEKNGTRIFVNVPDAKQIAVIDRDKRSILHKWTMEVFQANFPMALDESNHRLFVGCRKPSRLVVLDTEAGKPAADLAISGDTDDLFYDAKRKRLYLSCGEGFIDVVEQSSPDKFQRIAKVSTAPGARTSFFSPDLDRLYLAVPDRGSQKAEIRIFEPL